MKKGGGNVNNIDYCYVMNKWGRHVMSMHAMQLKYRDVDEVRGVRWRVQMAGNKNTKSMCMCRGYE